MGEEERAAHVGAIHRGAGVGPPNSARHVAEVLEELVFKRLVELVRRVDGNRRSQCRGRRRDVVEVAERYDDALKGWDERRWWRRADPNDRLRPVDANDDGGIVVGEDRELRGR